ncbi:transposase [Rhizobium leguminosarum]|uniref:Transposase n=1 Tax=Rhizobium leguminosarum TaxID=384 RepID=A0AAE2SXI4_RHILE|nr:MULTISPECIES: IS110 family transposase [Rhizobium]MBB4291460.1 transposase [Rhizobium leguminosarum]MBB4296157.1 transposase [Rhizobium leguminosarum]MBB4308584.1 transposase [Rhizobium leguminosarum]MBB4416419.1 transposase [Rhizobium leguminosarum]MBB4430614.1 transposase [Rhizobium esperanzae]
MSDATMIGLDLAKQVFQVHGADAGGKKLFNRKLQRSELREFFENLTPCVVAMEACASSNYWAREIGALGHRTLIIPAQYVKPFVKRGKTDALDAEAIAIAASQEGMRFVPVKSAEQQAITVLIKTRALLTRQKADLVNALRGHMAEFGFVANLGKKSVEALIAIVLDQVGSRLPHEVRRTLSVICDEIESLASKIADLERDLVAHSKRDDDVSRLMTIPGVGQITASTVKAYVPDPSAFKSARHFASWLGLTPKIHSSGGKGRPGGISKQGNPVLRYLLVMGAISVVRQSKRNPDASRWLRELVSRKPYRVAAVAIANKTARIIWALLNKGGSYGRDATIGL